MFAQMISSNGQSRAAAQSANVLLEFIDQLGKGNDRLAVLTPSSRPRPCRHRPHRHL
jgi:hypothetical protein